MPNGRDVTAIFDGSFDGFLTIIYKRYYEKLVPDHIVNRDCFQHMLFTEYVNIETDYQKAETVMNAIKKKISPNAQETAYMAFCASDDTRYLDIFKYIVNGFAMGKAIDNHMKLDYVLNVQNHAKFVGREAHLYKGFTRFKQTPDDIYFAEIEPVNDILPFLARHFADRLLGQNWVIYDTRRKLAAICDGRDFMIAETELAQETKAAPGEEAYQRLWRGFVAHIAVEGRINPKLQTQLLPKRYRRFMTEFTDKELDTNIPRYIT